MKRVTLIKRKLSDNEKKFVENVLGYNKIVIVDRYKDGNRIEFLCELDGVMDTVVYDDLISSLQAYRLYNEWNSNDNILTLSNKE